MVMLDESFVPAEDVSLEAYVQGVVDDLETLRSLGQKPDRARFKVREFPAETRGAIDWIRRFCTVRAKNAEGKVIHRQPNMGELVEGCVRCGLHRIESDFDLSDLKQTTRDLLDAGKVNFFVLQHKFEFHLQGALQPRVVCFQPYVFEQTANRIYDLSFCTSVQVTTLFTAAFVAGISQSEYWLSGLSYPYVANAESTVEAFGKWLRSVVGELLR